MISQQYIINTIKQNCQDIKNLGVQEIALFGSYARNEQKTNSDVDFYVVFDPKKKSARNYFGLYDLLEEKLNKKVDIVTRESAEHILYKYIKDDLTYVQI